MREILFRGKVFNDEWEYGVPVFSGLNNELAFMKQMHSHDYQVNPETVGQYTGLTDKNGKKIFEGDIVKCKDYLEAKPFEFQGYIDFKNGSYVIVGDFMTHYRWLDYEVEVIGNIHDNPELLKGGG